MSVANYWSHVAPLVLLGAGAIIFGIGWLATSH
jgi:hypothetical protein